MPLNIIADKNMPLVEDYFSAIGEVSLVDGRSLTQQQLIGMDVLLVRSVTTVDRLLLENTRIKFVGTATIGMDHIDQNYLKQNNIGFASAPGCNANSVAEFVLSALLATDSLQDLRENNKQLAIVGVGNVGSRVAEIADILGLNYICYDPPREHLDKNKQTPDYDWCSWGQVLSADVISLHVPYTVAEPFATKHLFSKPELLKLNPKCLLINSSRGGVVDNLALLEHLRSQSHSHSMGVVLDVWENEPNINLALRDLCRLNTPHIAGYSLDGKTKGTEMIFQAALNYFKIATEFTKQLDNTGSNSLITIKWSESDSFVENLKCCVFKAYNIHLDSESLDKLNPTNIRKSFDLLRQNYPDRLEFNHYLIEAVPRHYQSLIKALGFQLASPILETTHD